MRLRLRSNALARNPARSEKQIFNRSLVGGFVGAMVGYAVVNRMGSYPSTGKTIAGLAVGVLVGMGGTALAFGAKPKQLPRIMFGFPKG
jgi:hypothetical protein